MKITLTLKVSFCDLFMALVSLSITNSYLTHCFHWNALNCMEQSKSQTSSKTVDKLTSCSRKEDNRSREPYTISTWLRTQDNETFFPLVTHAIQRGNLQH